MVVINLNELVDIFHEAENKIDILRAVLDMQKYYVRNSDLIEVESYVDDI